MKEIWNTKKRNAVDVLILDGYVDEPSLLGVPPYISPEPRLLAGVAECEGLDWEYLTADEYRRHGLPKAKAILLHGGVTVPGKYLVATPLSEKEASNIANQRSETFLGGPLARYGEVDGFDHYVEKDLSAYFFETLKGTPKDRWITPKERELWSVQGARVVRRHPMFPDPLIAEVSMYRGCPRYFTGGCEFCTEPDYGKPNFRDQEEILSEVKELYSLGVKHFRLGGQSCTLSYKSKGIGRKETPIPQPREVISLFKNLNEECPRIKVLHTDNANPAVISEYPRRARKILNGLVRYTTPGNILALGMESADENVIEVNNLNSTPDQVEKAITMINELGAEKGANGMPKLLPGLNFLGGLSGETPETYERNMEFLRRIRERGLWLRRINIRQVLSHNEEFKMEQRSEFREFKKRVREEIERPLLMEMFPKGTVIRRVYMEKREGKKTFGRQIGTYPLLVGVRYPLKTGRYYDILVTEYGYRSITGIHHPFTLTEASYEQLQAIPGVGEKRAAKIFRHRPSTKEELDEIIENGKNLLKYVSFNPSHD
ncbi:MAG: radical SAM protein [Candidatus Hadarchaeota archaeon]